MLSGISKLDPHDAVDSITGMVLDQIFEAPYGIAVGDAQVKPLLFEPLRAEGKLQAAKSFRLIRNPHHAGKSGVDEVVFRTFPAAEDGTPRARRCALRAGEIDLTNAVTMAEVSGNQIAGNYDLALTGWIADTPDPADFLRGVHTRAVARRHRTPGLLFAS